MLAALGEVSLPRVDAQIKPQTRQHVRRPGQGMDRADRRRIDAAAKHAAAAVVKTLAAANASRLPGAAADALIPIPPEGSTEATLVEQVRQRINNDLELRNRRRAADGKPPLLPPADHQPRAMVDMAHYGLQYGQVRFFVLHLIVDNPLPEPLVIGRGDVSAKIDGEAKSLDDVPDQLKTISFPYGSQQQTLQNHEQFQEFRVPPQGVGGTWLIFGGLPLNAEVPAMSLSVRINTRPIEIDVTESQWALLDLVTEVIGPRGCLRLITVQGMLNSVNVQSLIAHLEQLTERQTVRFVLQWKENAIPPEQQLSYWLVNSALQLGAGRQAGDQFPAFPALIREFHIVQPTGNGFPSADQFGRPNLGQRLHKSAAEGVAAALKSAYLALPVSELPQEIEQGHPLSRAAALRHGAGRLSASQLPIVLKLVDDPDAHIQRSAVQALSQFGEPAARETLVRLAKHAAPPDADDGDSLGVTAIESLAVSRYAVAQTALLDLLKTSDPKLKSQIMQVLARHPRPQWSETIFAFVTDPQHTLTTDGVRALLQVGHPRLVDVLETGLKSPDKSVRQLIFPILAQRTDPRSERLATDYALTQLAHTPPDAVMNQFLHRIKLAPAVPLLLKHLETAPDKGAIIGLLTQIGDETVGDAISDRYDKLPNHEKGQALNALRVLRHKKFSELAGAALLGNDASMIGQASQGLMQDGGAEACQLLVTALEKQTNSHAWHSICNALGNLGRPAARDALLAARNADNIQKKNAAINGLNIYYQRSPGYQYIWQALNVLQQNKKKNWKEALDYYDMSLQIDPDLPEALAGRGCMLLRLGKVAEAVKTLEKAHQLDPFNHLAIPGLAEARITAGNIDDGLKLLESGRERFQHDGLFLQGSGRVYALAAARISQQEDIPDRDQRRAEYLKKAIADIQQSVTRGFADLDWLRDDPELQPLKNDPDFKKLVGSRPPPPDDDTPADVAPQE